MRTMSHIGKHVWVLQECYQLILPELGDKYFSCYRQIRRHEGMLGPDCFHSIKFLTGNWGYKKYNHMNSELFSGAIDKAEEYYYRLVNKLKSGRGGAREAAWLAHFVVDAIEPAHLTDWRRGKDRRKKLRRHLLIEKQTEKIKNKNRSKLIIVSGEVKDYLIDKSRDIRSLNLWECLDSKKQMSVYKEKIVSWQIEAVAGIWLKAVKEAGA